MRRLEPQLSSRVAIYTLEDTGVETIGTKRQRMLDAVKHEKYLCFIDDDDLVSEDYCASILKALDSKPDVVGFRLRYFVDGVLDGTSIISARCKCWSSERQGALTLHYRTPNHLSPVRTEMAKEIGFKGLQTGEDADYSNRLYERYPDMREAFIDEHLYDYFYRTPKKRLEREDLVIPDPA